ncbi:cytochrome P450 [Paecilomyces variotii]|uniref:Cytochrome P450 n=1 Tax=Byssochlamys spectabilis TaxID=264951 RepID=A0A443HNX2_BYSSP|nr:cytochrome P450 [Paecilomyces variotii]KAJ9350283.1 hypothetical protein DTO280E4_8726 [Paecilomyces variotii]RWQ93515.1 cytochrome P450 [Paecilomyces variotii]
MAVLESIISLLYSHALILLLIVPIIRLGRNYFTPGARSVPGPFFAKLTNLWRFIDVAKGRPEVTLYRLHKKHGDYVRLGPNVVSVRNLEVLKEIYGINKGYQKTTFYRVQQQLVNGRPSQTLFTTLNDDFHAAIKRPISAAYSMSTLTEFEPFVDNTIHTFFRRLDEFAEKNEPCDIAKWLQYYAFDVIGELTFSKALGFLESGHDVDGIVESIEKNLDYAGKTGQMPWLDYLFVKNPLRQLLRGGSTTAIAQFARNRVQERLSQSDTKSPTRRDFLSRFFEAKEIHPNIVDDKQVISYTISNVNAGSDTTAISLRAILYYTLKHPNVYSKLRHELDEAKSSGRISSPVTWKESQELPYLDAVIKEALRLHPAVGLLLERIVPDGGLKLPDGPYLPPGTIVGVNPWIIHRKDVFGEDVDAFIPERWLQGGKELNAEFAVRKQKMIRATYTFGAGTRTCIGKNISLLEIYKLIPSLFQSYNIELENLDREWEIVNAWFVRQKNMDIKLSRR